MKRWIILAALVVGIPAAAGTHDTDTVTRSVTIVSSRPALGVQLTELTPDLRRWLGADPDEGVLVASVVDGSAAEVAGVKVGDVLLDIAGDEVASSWDAVTAVSRHPGDDIALRLLRDRKAITLQATLPEAGPGGGLAFSAPDPEHFRALFEDMPRFGVTAPPDLEERVRELEDRMRELERRIDTY